MIKQCVLIGAQGSGKTTLFNKLSNQSQTISDQIDSCTKVITTAQSKDAFLVVDTPGISFAYDILKHSIAILAALTNGPIHKILLVVEYKYRLDSLYEEIHKIIPLVERYKKLLGVVITHFDRYEQNKAQQYLYQIEATKMIEKEFLIKQVIFSSKDSNGEQLSSDIQRNLLQIGQDLNISDDAFDKLMLGYKYNKTLDEGKKDFQNKLVKFKDTVINFLEGFEQTVDQDQILHSLQVFVRQEQNLFLEQFIKDFGPIMDILLEKLKDPILSYYYYYIVKYHIKDMVTNLTKEINKRMIYPEDHPFRMLRRCPKCNTIWLKVIGCDNYCGNRLFNWDEQSLIQTQPIYNQYEFYYLNQEEIDYKEVELNYDQLEQFKDAQLIKLREGDDFHKLENFIKELFQQKIILQSDVELTNETITQILQFEENLKKVNKKSQTISPLRKKAKQLLLEKQQQKQIQKYGQIGCGYKFVWDNAPIVNIDDIDLNQQEIIALISDKEAMYKQDYKIFKKEQINEALKNIKSLQKKV